ncbi:ornithine cyclodeaminase family protein [Verrucomicrobiales bacterium]|nr:ornithine cyclodeaminase family protein [Verrucomicrobiales bacterium]MDB4721846.1 ornithine cyclodeaminase family protein [Verrucomicrobiales bacterium]
MKVISAEEVHAALSYPELVDSLHEAYGGKYSMPPRQVFLLDENTNHDAFAVLPSWNDQFIGVKSFTYFPEAELPYKSLYSKILLFDRAHGEPLALVDGTTVTFWRTAGISGLATRLLSREDSETMLLLGTGNLAPYIIRANLSVRFLKRVMVWGRNLVKAESIVEMMQKEFPDVDFSAIEDRQAACAEADIVVAATGSHDPVVLGEWIRPGTHTDFIGNHHADKRECDTELIKKAKVYADSRVNAFKEAGEILIPINEGVFAEEGVVAELSEMCRGDAVLRENEEEVTLFKSIGMAMSDLVGAGLAYNEVIKN